jgi:hypothetical protein
VRFVLLQQASNIVGTGWELTSLQRDLLTELLASTAALLGSRDAMLWGSSSLMKVY